MHLQLTFCQPDDCQAQYQGKVCLPRKHHKTLAQAISGYNKLEPSLQSGPGTPHSGWRLGPSKWGLLMILCKGPVHVPIKANLIRKNRIFNVVKIGKLGSPDFMMLPGNRIKRCAKIWAISPHHLGTALSRMSWILVCNWWTSEASITPLSQPCIEALLSTKAVLVWELSCSVSEMAWAIVPVAVWKTLIS